MSSLPREAPIDPRTRVLLETPLARTVLRLAAPNTVVMLVQASIGLIPLAFGFGAPLVALVGTSIGAGNRARALRAAWIGSSIAAVLTEAVGLINAAALAHGAWFDRPRPSTR